MQSNVLREWVRMRSKRGLTTPHPEGHQLCQYIIRLIRIQEERNIRSAKQSKWSGYHADIWQSACWWLHADPVLPCSCLWDRQGPRLTWEINNQQVGWGTWLALRQKIPSYPKRHHVGDRATEGKWSPVKWQQKAFSGPVHHLRPPTFVSTCK